MGMGWGWWRGGEPHWVRGSLGGGGWRWGCAAAEAWWKEERRWPGSGRLRPALRSWSAAAATAADWAVLTPPAKPTRVPTVPKEAEKQEMGAKPRGGVAWGGRGTGRKTLVGAAAGAGGGETGLALRLTPARTLGSVEAARALATEGAMGSMWTGPPEAISSRMGVVDSDFVPRRVFSAYAFRRDEFRCGCRR